MTESSPFSATGFHYQNNQLYCEGVRLADLAAAVGTPVYIYSQATIVSQAQAYLANATPNSLVCFAVKAN